MMPKYLLPPILMGFFLFVIVACTPSQDQDIHNILKDETIYIGVSWSEDRDLFVAGARLAAKEANESGGILGHQVQLIVDEHEESVLASIEAHSTLTFGESGKETSRAIARDFANSNHALVGVIGHRYSPMAFAAAHIYQENSLPFIAPTASNILLTTMSFDLVFRMVPTTTVVGEQLATYMHAKKYKRVAVFNERSVTALELSDSFSQNSSELGVNTVMQHSFFSTMPDREITRFAIDFRRLSNEKNIDAIALFTSTKLSLKIIEEFRKRGIKSIPFIGSNDLDNKKFWQPLQAWQTENNLPANVTLPTTFNPQSPLSHPFVQKFQHEYNKTPGRLAAIAYDSVNILLQSVKNAGEDHDGIKTADELRYGAACRGLTGRINYQDNGDVANKTLVIKQLNQDGFSYRNLDDKDASNASSLVSLVELQKCLDHDRDNDGIVNNVDQCADDAAESLSAGIYMEGERMGCPLDTDHDGVATWHDQCAQDSVEAISKGVDPYGCPNDQDRDKVPDYRDQCVNDSYASLGNGVNATGCPMDSDDDGVPDYRDEQIENTHNEISKGVNSVGVPLDRDADGFPDYRDPCPLNSPEEISHGINAEGCALDGDHDGVANYLDQCQNSSAAEVAYGVNATGCAQDSDADGVADSMDRCPNNQPKALSAGVDLYGCAVDRDGDAVPDYRDACANNSKGEVLLGVNALGCPLDSDGDTVPDYRDQCRSNTTEELMFGVDSYGCAVDLDADTVPDYHDKCRINSKEELTFGVDSYGCAVDLDKDSVPDYRDKCRKNTKVELTFGVDSYGCAIDVDRDTVPDYRDQCRTNSKVELAFSVDSYGCAVDVDTDTIPDYRDQCRTNTKAELAFGVDSYGCAADVDADMVPDYRDHCRTNSKEELAFGVDNYGCAVDVDADTVPDYRDKCRTNSKAELVFGVDVYGCAVDTDTDTVPDYRDECRSNTKEELGFGVNKHGCPVDSDTDKVPDYLDQCRTNSKVELAVGVNAQGCPIDKDADGVPDFRDACRHTAVNLKVDQYGCVEVKAVTFASDQSFDVGKAILSAEAKKTLQSFVHGLNMGLLKKIDILAYTDDRGSDAFNLRLSKARARAVESELKKLGVSPRFIHAEGAGESNPIASNASEEGRAKNRRVDIKVDMLSSTSPTR